MDITLFLGRFHPLVVHLPITLILLGGLMHFLSTKGKYKYLDSAVSFVLLLGAVFAIVAAILGWFIANDRGYDPNTLFFHRWLGITVVIGSILLCLIRFQLVKVNDRLFPILMIVIMGMVGFTGHLGGNLTHGEGYLTEYAPDFVRDIFQDGSDNQMFFAELPTQPDSVYVFNHIISPIIEAKCGNCHNESQKKGGLNLLTVDGLEEGGDNGEVFILEKPFESEIILRTTLPPRHTKFMPPKGTPLSFSEIELLKWWINSGASFDLRFSALESNSTLATLLKRDYGLDPKSRPIYELIAVDPISNEDMEQLQQNGFTAKQLSQNNNYLEINVSPDIKELSVENLRAILSVSDKVTWLDLSGAGITDEHLEIIGQLEKLTLLRLNSNDISDEGLPYLNKLKYLESLNLYDTKVSDKGLTALESIYSLKRAYLWQTLVTSDGVSILKEKLPNLAIDIGAVH